MTRGRKKQKDKPVSQSEAEYLATCERIAATRARIEELRPLSRSDKQACRALMQYSETLRTDEAMRAAYLKEGWLRATRRRG